jgi:thioredoxin 1
MAIKVNDANFKKEVLESDLPVLVDFWAEWCGPCLMVAPVVESVEKKYEGRLKVCKVNVDEAPNTSSEYGIMSIPTLAIFKNGIVAEQIIGAVSESEISSKVELFI